jgi:hypothetical protein
MNVVVIVLAFYIFFTVLGLNAAKIRGDFLLFMLSGIFLYSPISGPWARPSARRGRPRR